MEKIFVGGIMTAICGQDCGENLQRLETNPETGGPEQSANADFVYELGLNTLYHYVSHAGLGVRLV
jgi:hypothetical protein